MTVPASVPAFLVTAIAPLMLGTASLAFADVIEPASKGRQTISRAIMIDALPSNDTGFSCVDPPPPGINNADIWVDSNGDGLPGPDLVLPAGTNFAVDVWIDTHSYAWTNFFVGLALVPEPANWHQYLNVVGVAFHVTGGEGFPLDDFTLPWALGMGGFLFPEYSGTQRLLTLSAQTRQLATPPGSMFCMTPIVSTSAPEGFFCSVGTQTSFSLFCAGTVDSVCYTILPPTARESTSWGRVKGLFK